MYSSSVPRQGRKRLRSNTKFTPWHDTWELEEVGRILLSTTSLFALSSASSSSINGPSEVELQYALQKITVWKSRSDQGRIPHSMETTAALAELLGRDYYGDSENHNHISGSTLSSFSSSSTFELRLAYSCALMRGVNGIADNMQQHKTYASSVASLCDMVGLPGWLVDLRHDAAHNDLPSLSALRLATQTFLVFLEQNYWIPLSTNRWELRKVALELLEQYKTTSKKKSTTATVSFTTHEKSKDESSQKEQKKQQEQKKEPTVSQTTNEEDKCHDNVAASDNGDDDSESDDTEEEWEDDHNINVWGTKSLGTNQNRFMALFNDTSASAEKKKKNKGKDKGKNNQKNYNNNKRDRKKRKAAAEGPPSPVTHVKKFVKTIPMDIGFQVALSFLVWGGMGSTQPEGRGALIPGSPASFPCTQEGITKIENRYKDLLITLCGAWPGFASTLLIHLVDFILSIENNEQDTQNENATATSGGHDDVNATKPNIQGTNNGNNTSEEEKMDEKNQTTLDPGSVRKLFFLQSWIKFLLSREFHMNYDKSVAIVKTIGGTLDLNKKRPNQWDLTDITYLRSNAPLNVLLRKAQYPLNSLCDRCCPCLEEEVRTQPSKNDTFSSNGSNESEDSAIQSSPSASSSVLQSDTVTEASKTSLEVYHMLRAILQDQRVVGLGVSTSSLGVDLSMTIPQQSSSSLPPPPSNEHGLLVKENHQPEVSSSMMIDINDGSGTSNNPTKSNKKNQLSPLSKVKLSSSEKMSLDALEALLSDSDDDDNDNGHDDGSDNGDEDDNGEDNNRSIDPVAQESSVSANANTNQDNNSNGEDVKDDSHKINSNIEENTATKRQSPPSIWVLCKTWEPCAIGTLPGFPV